jgi:hypothetical protein
MVRRSIGFVQSLTAERIFLLLDYRIFERFFRETLPVPNVSPEPVWGEPSQSRSWKTIAAL